MDRSALTGRQHNTRRRPMIRFWPAKTLRARAAGAGAAPRRQRKNSAGNKQTPTNESASPPPPFPSARPALIGATKMKDYSPSGASILLAATGTCATLPGARRLAGWQANRGRRSHVPLLWRPPLPSSLAGASAACLHLHRAAAQAHTKIKVSRRADRLLSEECHAHLASANHDGPRAGRPAGRPEHPKGATWARPVPCRIRLGEWRAFPP